MAPPILPKCLLQVFQILWSNRNLYSLISMLASWLIRLVPRNGLTPNEITVLHQSDDYLIINKNYDLVMNGEEHENSVAKQLREHFPHLVDEKVMFHFRFVHRLDFSTSGVLCVALNKEAAAAATDAFTRRTVNKFYLALVRGHVVGESLEVDTNIGNDQRELHNHKMCTIDKEYCINNKKAVTKMLVLERGYYDGYPASKLLIKPITGRRHQIRVHCAQIGHTIVGDYTYSNRKDVKPYRMFLHSYRLVIPTRTEHLDVTSADPFDEKDARNKWIVVSKVNSLNENVFNKI